MLLQVRTQTLVKNAIVLVDSTPFKQYYQQHYGIELGTKKKVAAGLINTEEKEKEEVKKHSAHVNRKHAQRAKNHKLDPVVRPPELQSRACTADSGGPFANDCGGLINQVYVLCRFRSSCGT